MNNPINPEDVPTIEACRNQLLAASPLTTKRLTLLTGVVREVLWELTGGDVSDFQLLAQMLGKRVADTPYENGERPIPAERS